MADLTQEFDDDAAAAEAVGGGIYTALDPLRMREVLGVVAHPRTLLAEAPRLVSEWAQIALGMSSRELPTRGTPYDDPLWHQHPVFRRLALGHLALTGAIERGAHDPAADWQAQERARYLVDIVTGALSPANVLVTNPVAWRCAIETRGRSVVRGARNFLRDALHNNRMPAMVNAKPFQVGENLATSPGAVVYREEMFELLQYTTATEHVHARPLLFVPPELNRHYVLDLAPERSMVEYTVAHGVQAFMVVWRNPRKDPNLGHGRWTLEDYLQAHVRAIDVVRDITGADDLNILGLCAGGITVSLTQAHLASRGETTINAATYLVTMLDARRQNMATMMATPEAAQRLDKQAEHGKVIDARAVANNFAWMRPDDLVYRYVVKNWLLGDDPPVFDVLAWNDDATNMAGAFARDSNQLLASDKLVTPGAVTLLDTPIDLNSVKTDGFFVIGQRDHITTWRPCYMTTRLFGGDTEVVLVNSGHIQSFVNPVATSRYSFWSGPSTSDDPDAWLEAAPKTDGSWWPKWIDWLTARSGPMKDAPATLGNANHPEICPAPGTYVHEK